MSGQLMTRPEVLAFLNALEQRHDVNAMLFHGVHVWTQLRQKLGEHMLAHELSEPTDRIPAQPVAARKAAHLARGFRDMALRKPKWPTIDLLFFSENGHRVVWSGLVHDRFADPLVLAGRALGSRCGVVERLHGRPVTDPRAVPCARFDASPSMAAFASMHWRKRLPDPTAIPGLEALMKDAATVCAMPNMEFIAIHLHTFHEYLLYYSKLLGAIKPKTVFVVCWYTLENLAIQHFSRLAGIRTVDLQHGVQGPAHLAYGRWSVMPPDGYNTMPDICWCWDKSSADNIASWAPPARMRPVVLGDPWAAHSAALSSGSPWKTDGRKRVLYTAEPLPELLPAILLEAMRATRGSCQWLVRTHPAMPQLPERVYGMLRSEGLAGDVLVSPPDEVPLAAVLKDCQLHVTQYSSVVLEAANMGVPSIAIHGTAADLFGAAISDGALRIALRATDLIHGILNTPALVARDAPPEPLTDRLRRVLQ
jgi:hypothetical protein